MDNVVRVFMNGIEVGSIPKDQYVKLVDDAFKTYPGKFRIVIDEMIGALTDVVPLVFIGLCISIVTLMLFSFLLLITRPEHIVTLARLPPEIWVPKLHNYAIYGMLCCFLSTLPIVCSNQARKILGMHGTGSNLSKYAETVRKNIRDVLQIPENGLLMVKNDGPYSDRVWDLQYEIDIDCRGRGQLKYWADSIRRRNKAC